MGKDVIIACDFDSAEKTFAFLDKFTGRKPFVKIGMELYYAEGPAIVREIKKRGHKIFLDLKLHDIPNTVKKSMAERGVQRKARRISVTWCFPFLFYYCRPFFHFTFGLLLFRC